MGGSLFQTTVTAVGVHFQHNSSEESDNGDNNEGEEGEEGGGEQGGSSLLDLPMFLPREQLKSREIAQWSRLQTLEAEADEIVRSVNRQLVLHGWAATMSLDLMRAQQCYRKAGTAKKQQRQLKRVTKAVEVAGKKHEAAVLIQANARIAVSRRLVKQARQRLWKRGECERGERRLMRKEEGISR